MISPSSAKGRASETSRQSDLSGNQRLAYRRARDAAAPELHLMDFPGQKPFFFADFLQQVEASLPPVAEGEIGPDINLFRAKLFP